MKKILFGLFAVLALTFTSCKDEAGLPGPGDPVDVASEAVGVYTGTWTRTLASDPDNPVIADGSLTITQVPDENGLNQYYVVNVAAECAAIDLTAQSNANINPRYVFFNVAKSEFGNEFSGKITDKRTATMTFNLTITEGRKQYVYRYDFNGTKNGAPAVNPGPAL